MNASIEYAHEFVYAYECIYIFDKFVYISVN